MKFIKSFLINSVNDNGDAFAQNIVGFEHTFHISCKRCFMTLN